ncbi:hypothetical protein VTO58DRAFT_105140 [Aureobasidium pullulans]
MELETKGPVEAASSRIYEVESEAALEAASSPIFEVDSPGKYSHQVQNILSVEMNDKTPRGTPPHVLKFVTDTTVKLHDDFQKQS